VLSLLRNDTGREHTTRGLTHIHALFVITPQISPRSEDGNGVHIIRPLLKVTKDQLREYMTARGLDWQEDESNTSRKYKRNAVRLDLIPLMEKLAGGTDALKK
jgi:tRNA(Ile)-lysidine synthase TilS/MesJ